MPNLLDDWVPVVDVSEHQGSIDFGRMRANGVAGVIMRVGHGLTADKRFTTYWRDALQAGYSRDDLAVYSFINPKRGTAQQTADAMLRTIDRVVGDTRVGYMLDIESYRNEAPSRGEAPVRGPAFADYVRAHRAYIDTQSDGAYTFAYTNQAFWNSADGPNSVSLAGELEWLVPRYPVHSILRYLAFPLPATPYLWDEWAFARAAGPFPPKGADWLGWQFSADYNRQGSRYGCQSTSLDLNIIVRSAWERWTGRAVGGNMQAVDHVRIVDTRNGMGGSRLGGEEVRTVFVPATVKRPGWARGAMVNIGSVDPDSGGYISVGAQTVNTGTAAVNFGPGIESNPAVVRVVPLDPPNLASASFVVRSSCATDITIDFQGWTN